MSETESKYIFSDILVKGEANTIYEIYERFTAIKKEIKDNF
jgi:hypothetical protein